MDILPPTLIHSHTFSYSRFPFICAARTVSIEIVAAHTPGREVSLTTWTCRRGAKRIAGEGVGEKESDTGEGIIDNSRE